MNDDILGAPLHFEPRTEVQARIAAGEVAYYIVMRCADLPAHEYPPEIQQRLGIVSCGRCLEDCHLDTKAWLPGARIRCLHCAPKTGTARATQETIDEVRTLFRRKRQQEAG